MSISKGDTIPAHEFVSMGSDGPIKISTSELFDGKTVVLFAVPGAFTPTCHQNHLPGFLEHYDAMKEKGVDTIAVTGVNDVFVMDAWSQQSKGKGKIVYLADGAADFAKAIGLEMDMSAHGMGVRSKRYSMLVKDGVVQELNIEPNPGQADTSGAATMLGQL